MRKRLTSFLLCFFMCVTLLPVSAQATEVAEANSPEIPTEGDVWDGSITQPTKLVQKDGVYYYEITKCSELAYVAQNSGEWMKCNYILGNNLILNDVTLTWDKDYNLYNTDALLVWESIGDKYNYFKGIFDGNNFIISGLYSTDTGLFRYANGATIRNVNIKNSYIRAQTRAYVGGIVGLMYNDGGCYNCSYEGVLIGCEISVGGICGDSSNPIDSCRFEGIVVGDEDVGGIVGTGVSRDCIVNNCSVSALVIGDDNVGGLAGELLSGSVKNSSFNGNIEASGSCSGGIAGAVSDYISNCYSVAVLNGINNVGGLVGACGGSIIDSYSACRVSGTGSVGGIVGKDEGLWSGDTTYSGCYYLKYEGYNDGIYGKGLTTEDVSHETSSITLTDIKLRPTFVDWDFENTWSINSELNDGYPYLQWQENELSDIAVNDVEISETTLALTAGDYTYLTATVSPFNASNKSVTWKSSDSDIVTVSAAGKVTAVSAGTAVITATTVDGGHTASCAVTVIERLAEEYRINSITVRDNDGAALSAIPNGNCLATVSITNLASEGNTLVFLAAYTSTGRYQGMMWVSVEDLPVGATIKVTLPVDNSDGKIANLKAFTIASFSNLTPLGEAVSFLP